MVTQGPPGEIDPSGPSCGVGTGIACIPIEKAETETRRWPGSGVCSRVATTGALQLGKRQTSGVRPKEPKGGNVHNSFLNHQDTNALGDFLMGAIETGVRIPKGIPILASERNSLIDVDEAAAGFLHPFHPTNNVGNWVIENLDWWVPALAGRTSRDLPQSLKRRFSGKHIPNLPAIGAIEGARIVTRAQIGPNGFSIDPREALISTKAFEFRIPIAEACWLLPIRNASVSRLFLLGNADHRPAYPVTTREALARLPIPRLTKDERSLLGRLTASRITATRLLARGANRSMVLRYLEQVLDAMVFEIVFREEVLDGLKMSFFETLAREDIPEPENREADRLKRLFRRIFNRNHLVRRGVYFLRSIKSVRLVEHTIAGLSHR